MGLTAIILGVVGAAVATATAVTTAVGGYMQAQQQADMLDYNSKLAARNAEQENLNAAAAQARAAAAADAEQQEYMRKEQLEREQNAKLRSYNLAVAGESGVGSDSGSSLLVAVDNAVNGEINALDIRRIGENSANNIRYQGELNAFEHRLNASRYSAESSMLSAQSSAVESSGKYGLITGLATAPVSGTLAGVETAWKFR